jgi:hypothetical protein
VTAAANKSGRPVPIDIITKQDEEPPIEPLKRRGTSESVSSFRSFRFSSLSKSPTYPSLRRSPTEDYNMLEPKSQDPRERLTPDGLEKDVLPSIHVSQNFYPVHLLQELVRQEVLTSILQENDIDVKQGELVRFICDHAKRIFVILVSQEEIPLITYFFEHKCTDDMLPLQRSVISEDIESFQDCYAELGIVRDTFRDLVLGSKSGKLKAKNFVYGWQW